MRSPRARVVRDETVVSGPKCPRDRLGLSGPATRGERGSATVFVIGFALVLFLCAGLVIDGGLAINKRMRIADDAEQAARLGADSIDVDEFRRTETLVIDQPLAQQRIADYMSTLGYSSGKWSVRFVNGQVSVTVDDRSKTYILSLFKVTFPVHAAAQAVPDTGQGDPVPAQPAPGP